MPDPILDLILRRKSVKNKLSTPSSMALDMASPYYTAISSDDNINLQFELDDVNNQITGFGFDPDKVENKIGDLPYNTPDFLVRDVLNLEDPVEILRKKSAIKWQAPIARAIENIVDPAAKERAKEELSYVYKGIRGGESSNYETAYNATKSAIDIIRKQSGEKDDMLKNLRADSEYGLSKMLLKDPAAQKRWDALGLNPIQGLALDMRELFDDNGSEYKNQIINKVNDPSAISEQNFKKAELEREGYAILGSEVDYLLDKKSSIVNKANDFYNANADKLQELGSAIKNDRQIGEELKVKLTGFQKEYSEALEGRSGDIITSPYSFDYLKEKVDSGKPSITELREYNRRVGILNGIVNRYKGEFDTYNNTVANQNTAANEYNKIVSKIQESYQDVSDYNNLTAWAEYIAKKRNTLGERYPEYKQIELEGLVKDLAGDVVGMGKKTGFRLANSIGGEAVDGIRKAWNNLTIWNGDKLREVEMGDAYRRRVEDVIMGYETGEQMLKDIRSVIPVVPKDVQKQIDAVRNSNLSNEEKYQKNYQIVSKAFDDKRISYVANPKYGKYNITADSILNTVSNVSTQFIGQMVQAYLSGGFGDVSKLRRLVTLFGTTAAQTFSREYDAAIQRGESNPFQQALVKSGIEGLSELPFDNIQFVKGLSPNASRILGDLSESQWAALKSRKIPSSIGREFARSVEMVAKEGALEEGLAQVGGNIADKYMFSKDKELTEGLDVAILAGTIGFAPLSIIGLPLRYRSANMGDKLMMYQAGYKADQVIENLNQQVADGSITSEEAKQRIEAVKLMKQVVGDMNMYDVNGKPLTDNQKAQYAFNEYVKLKAKNTENLPEQQKLEAEQLVKEADQSSSNILNGTDDATYESTRPVQGMPAEGNLQQPQTTGEGQQQEVQAEVTQGNVSYSDLSSQEVDINEAPQGLTDIAAKVMQDAFATAKSLAKTGIKVRVFQKQEDFERESSKLGQQARGQGIFMADGKNILINLSKINNEADWGIVWHEGAHPVMNIIRNTKPELYNKMAKGFGNLAKQGGVFSQIESWAESDYGTKTDQTADEAMVETISLIGDGKIGLQDIPTSFRQQVIDFVNQIADYLGLGQLADTSERVFVQKAAQIARSLSSGEDISSIVGAENVTSFQNPFVQQRITASDVLSKEDRGDNKVIEVAETFEKAVDEVLDPQSDPQKRITRFIKNAYEDLRYFLAEYKGDTGLDWYTNKVKEFDSKLEDSSDIAIRNNEMPSENSLRIKENMDLFKVVLALSSIGVNPRENVKAAFAIWKTFNQESKTFSKYQPGLVSVRTNIQDKKGKYEAPSGEIVKEGIRFFDLKQKNGKIIRVNKADLAKEFEVTFINEEGNKSKKKLRFVRESGKNIIYRSGPTQVKIPKDNIIDQEESDDGVLGKGWTTKGNIVAINLNRLESVLADHPDLKSTLDWINSKHPIVDLRKYNKGVPDIEGKKGKINPKGERLGSYIIGEKLGAFHQNVAGTPTELTMDLWWSRTWNRYMGTLIGKDKKGEPIIQETPRTDNERNIMREAAKTMADSLGLEVHELQAALWYLEQQMYKRMGAAVESYSFVDGINELLLQYGKSREEIQPERYGIDSTEADQRRTDAAARAANILYGESSGAGEAEVARGGNQERRSVAFSAPLYDFSLRDQQGNFTTNAQSVRESDQYKKYAQDIYNVASLMGVNLEEVQNLIGGFENEQGKKIVEVAAKSNIDVDDFNKAIKYAAVLGAIAPETQESTIAARYVEAGYEGHNADEYVLTVSDPDAAIKALTDIGVYNFSVNESTKEVTLLNIFAFPTEDIDNIIDNFASKLNEYGVQYTAATKSAIQSEYIDYNRRQEIITDLQGDALYEQGGQRLRDVIDNAKQRNEEFIRKKQGQERRSAVITDLNTSLQERKSAAKITSKAIDSLVDIVTRLGYGYLPENVREKLKKKQRLIDADMNDMNVLSQRLDNAVREEYGVSYKKLDQKTLDLFDQALRNFGSEMSFREKYELSMKIPDQILSIIEQMRGVIDGMSLKLIDIGVLDSSLEPAFDGEKGLGVYLTRTYKKYDDPEWVNKIPEPVRNRAIQYLKANNFVREFDQAGNEIGERELTEDEIEGLVNYIATNMQPVKDSLTTANLGKTKVDILKGRKVIPEEIRDLMGEYKDPMVNFANSIAKMSTLIHTHQTLKAIAEANMGTLFFERPSGENYAPVAGEDKSYLQPLSGLYTTPEVAEAFKKVQESLEGGDINQRALRFLAKVNGVVKVGKTALSPASWVRNVIGGHILMLKDGHLGGTGYAEGWKKAIGYFANKNQDDPEFQAKVREYIEMGILGEGVQAGEFRAIIKAAQKHDDPIDWLANDSKLGRFVDGVKGFYSAQDDIFRVWAYENEKSRLQKRKPDMNEAQLQAEASRKARATYPTYSEVPEVIRQLAKFIPISSFPAFSAELIRTTKNSFKIAYEEIKDPQMRDVGIKRLIGAISAVSFGGILSATTAMLVGVGDEEEKSLRRYLPTWSRNSPLVWLGRDDNGLPRYIDLGFSDPFSYFKKPVVALMNEDDDLDDRIKSALGEAAAPFVSPEILLSALMKGTKKVRETDDTIDLLGRYAGPVYEALEPGLAASIRRIWKGVAGDVDNYGNQYDAGLETLAFFSGQRIKKFDVQVGFSFKARAFNTAKSEVTKDYGTEKSKTTKDSEKVAEELVDANEKLEKYYDQFKKDYDAARVLMGTSMTDAMAKKILKGIMKDRNIPKDFIKAIEKNNPYPVIEDDDK